MLAVILATAAVIGESLISDSGIVLNIFTFVELFLLMVLYYIIIHIINYGVLHISKGEIHRLSRGKYVVVYLVMFLTHVPHLILKYPAGNCLDTIYQIQQGLGDIPLNTHHPLFHTLLMTIFVKVGLYFGSANAGIFAFVLLQTLAMDLVFSYSIYILNKCNVPRSIVCLSLAFYCLSPFIIGYVGQPIKDVYYNVFVVLFIIELFELSVNLKETILSLRWIVLLVVSSIGMVLFRKDGYVLVFSSVLVIAFILLRQYVNKNITLCKSRANRILLIVGIMSALLLPLLINEFLIICYNPLKGSIKEALSFPLQQTARVVKYYADEIDSDDREVINRVVSFDDIGEAYNPVLSDPVKATGPGIISTGDVIDYLLVWEKIVFRYPKTCLRATIEQNIYLIYPNYSMHTYFVDASAYRVDSNGNPLIFDSNAELRVLQDKYLAYLNNLHTLPILKDINNAANYVILFLITLLICLNRKNKLSLIMFIPLVISILIVIIGPGIKYHVRYLFPIVWSTPFWVSQLVVNK